MEKKNTQLSEQQIFEYILGSFQLVQNYLKRYNYEKFDNDIKIKDAVCHRMFCIGVAAKDISKKFYNKYPNFPWIYYVMWETENEPDLIWEFVKENKDELLSIDLMFDNLEKIYLTEYFNSDLDKKNISTAEWSNDYEYPIKTSNSIWTVKKK